GQQHALGDGLVRAQNARHAPDGTRLSPAMAKKDKDKKSKKKGKNGTPDTVEAVRTAVERTFQATAEGAQAGRGRPQELVQDGTAAAAKVRELFEESRVLDDL